MSNNPSFAPAPVPGSPTPQGNNDRLATFSLIAGIVGIVLSCVRLIPFVNCCATPLAYIAAIAGLVLGFLGLKSSKKTLAIVGLVLSGLTIVIPIVTVIISTVFNLGVGGLDVLSNIGKGYWRPIQRIH